MFVAAKLFVQLVLGVCRRGRVQREDMAAWREAAHYYSSTNHHSRTAPGQSGLWRCVGSDMMRNNTSQCGVVSSDTHTSVRQHIPSAAPATPRPSSPGRVTRPWSFQHPAHTRLPPCCEPWLCGRGTSGSARPADRPWARHNGSAHAFCHLYTALAHQEGRFSARSVRTRPAKGVGKPQLTSRTPATAPQLFRVLTSNDQESTFPGDLIHHPSYTRNDHIKVPIAVRKHTACAAAVGSTPALCGEFERNAAY